MTIQPKDEDREENGLGGCPLTVPCRVLSIQSHVAFGYVGGKAAVFPLQCMGYDVDFVSTVNFSNHTGYGRFGGTKTSAEELTCILDSMQQSGVLVPDRLLTGYVPNAESLAIVHELVKKLKSSHPNLVYLLDPVLGDSGKLYVSETCISVYRQMLPLANIITPNWFEAEVLAGVSLTDLASLRASLRRLHTLYHVPNVVISSIPLSKISAVLPSYLHPPMQPNGSMDDERSYLICIASSVNDNDDMEKGTLSTVYAGCVELLPGHFHSPPKSATEPSSTVSKSLPPLAYAASHALSKTHAILTLTHESASTLSLPSTDDELDAREPDRKNKRMKSRELRIIQGQYIFRRKEWDGVTKMSLWEGFWDDLN
ncbi:bud site selection protein 16 [Chiua virens]|nr:bud site selection protein 16 [Chiua virens]